MAAISAPPPEASAATSSQKQSVIRDRISAAIARRLARTAPSPDCNLTLENEALRKELAELRRAVAERDDRLKVVESVKAELGYKLAQATTDAQIELAGELAEERQRVSEYMKRSDAQLAAIKSGMSQIASDIAEVDRDSRIAMARAIVKSRQHRRALRNIAALRQTVTEITGRSSDPGIEVVTRSTPTVSKQAVARNGKTAKGRYVSKRRLTMAR